MPDEARSDPVCALQAVQEGFAAPMRPANKWVSETPLPSRDHRLGWKDVQMDETTCAICGGPLTSTQREFRVSGGTITRPGEAECRNGCTDTTEYPTAREARADGQPWAPKEPSHCGVSMVAGGTNVKINDVLMHNYVCQICRELERHPA